MIRILFPYIVLMASCSSYKNIPKKEKDQMQILNTDTLTIDHDEVLSEQEVILLNHLLKNLRDTFDFHGKKVAFITGSSGNRLLSKADYFNQIKPWLDAGDTPQASIVLLTEEEKDKSGGYDVLVLSWVKVFSER
ncbi:MAG TPA: hypothetical protein VFD91_17615 [Mariniphaga sp.]|nr:hypothetical protein [Mariniphaga sp.]